MPENRRCKVIGLIFSLFTYINYLVNDFDGGKMANSFKTA